MKCEGLGESLGEIDTAGFMVGEVTLLFCLTSWKPWRSVKEQLLVAVDALSKSFPFTSAVQAIVLDLNKVVATVIDRLTEEANIQISTLTT